MRALFHFEEPAPVREPVHSDIPDVNGAELASVYYGRRMAGDFYDFIRVCPNRVLFGLLDVAGGLEDTRAIVSAAQHTFRTAGVELFARKDLNEADAMMELCLQLNHSILKAANGVRSCPAFAGCYDESLGIVCYFNAGHTPGLARDRNGISRTSRHRIAFGTCFPTWSRMLPWSLSSPVQSFSWLRVELSKASANTKSLDCNE